MADTLDQLVAKLAGTSEQVQGVRQQVEDIKAAAADTIDLRRDGKRSVKKELRDEEDDEIFGSDSDDDDLDATVAETGRKLVAMKAEADQLEKDVKTAAKATDNVKVSVTKMGLGEEVDAEQASAIARRLEGTIKDKLAKLGIDTGNRPIEVKLVTSQLPEGLELGEQGDPQNDQQVQSMFFNMMTGNIQGYEDIDSQRRAEASYKFRWEE